MNNQNYKNDYKLLIAACLVSIVAGLFGGWFCFYTATWYLGSNSLMSPKFTESFGPNSSIVIQDAKKIVVEQDEKIAETISGAKKYLFGFYKMDKAGGVYEISDSIAQGLSITTDGWLIVKAKTDLPADWYKNYYASGYDRKLYKIEKVYKDSLNDLWFVKVADLQGVTVAPLASSKAIQSGQFVVTYGLDGSSSVNNFSHFKRSGKVLFSDFSKKELVVNGGLADNIFVAMNLSGEIIGLTDNSHKIYSIDDLINPVNSILKEQVITRQAFGVYYKNVSGEISDKPHKGALITKPEKGEAVVKGSPAEEAGLKEGDLILAVDGTEINEVNDLADLLSTYHPKDKIYIKYKRDANEDTVEVKLGIAK